MPAAVKTLAGATLPYGDNPSGILLPTSNSKSQSTAVFNLSGQEVDDTFRGIVIKNGRKIVQ